MTLLKQNIFAHRGHWDSKISQNSSASFANAFNSGFSIETDLRSHGTDVVISHDHLVNKPILKAGSVTDFNSRFALNIKSDGLQEFFLTKQKWIKETKSFFFDGSVPELYKYKNAGLPVALRLSEFEKELPWACEIIWLDSFYSEWWIKSDQLIKLSEKHFVIVVSPELHHREYSNAWDKVMGLISQGNTNIGICTDYPDKFSEVFGAKNAS